LPFGGFFYFGTRTTCCRAKHPSPSRGTRESDDDLSESHKDWLLQMQSIAMHNIGNIITVAKLSVNELEESGNNSNTEAMDLLLDEMLPTLQERVEAGDVASFLTNDAKGREYIGSMRELLVYQKTMLLSQADSIAALKGKLLHTSEILDLQHQLPNALGTFEETSITRILDDAVTMMSESAERNEIRIECDYRSREIVLVDRSMLTQVFVNLLKNSIQAFDGTALSSKQIQISTQSTTRNGCKCVLTDIKDNGQGIPTARLDRIFDFGFSTKKASGHGKGMDLHFCRKSVENFDGLIAAKSRPNEGATFSVWLKCATG